MAAPASLLVRLTGITVSKGDGRQWLLRLALQPQSDIGQVTPANIRLTTVQGAPVTDLAVLSVTSPSQMSPLLVTLNDLRPITTAFGDGDPPPVILTLTGLDDIMDPAANYAGFLLGSMDPDRQATPESGIPAEATAPLTPGPALDYMARDYPALRQAMLDQLSVLVPGFKGGEGPADFPVMLVETLAYAADQLSYFQDAVATEAYLGTARLRRSVRRHVRLIDYRLHEGCNARAWIQVAVKVPVLLPAGTAFAAGSTVFVAMADTSLDPSRNRIALWAPPLADTYVIPQGAITAMLAGPATLQRGDVLVFEEIGNPDGMRIENGDPSRRHAVRLTSVSAGQDGTRITWDQSDALPFPITVVASINGQRVDGISLALGNIVLADEGAWQAPVLLPEAAPFTGVYQPSLPPAPLVYATARPPVTMPASLCLTQDPRAALPQISLVDAQQNSWQACLDLLDRNSFMRVVTVEPDANGRHNRLRFGDGVYGRKPAPGSRFTVAIRAGGGSAGNVGAEAINSILNAAAPMAAAISAIRNPLPAAGGLEPEAIEDARLYAPQAFRSQQRCVTPEDFAARAMTFPGVLQAAAQAAWSGSWRLMQVSVCRRGAAPLDPAFMAELARYLDRFRCAGVQVAIAAPRRIGIDLGLVVYCVAGAQISAIRAALNQHFGTGYLPDGTPAFFNPDILRFGAPVRLSDILEVVTAIPGVAWVDSDPRSDPRARFYRADAPVHGLEQRQVIDFAPLEIASAAPEDGGRILFYATRAA